MKNPDLRSKIVFLSTYPPTQCGIATYTQDTIKGIENVFGHSLRCEICDLLDNSTATTSQLFSIRTKDKAAYQKTALEINANKSVQLVHIQHEFGLFGGVYGDFLLEFLNAIEIPVAFTFHSVIPNPNPELKTFVKLIISYTKSIFVMTKQSEEILIRDYDVNHEYITCVPHGTHTVLYETAEEAKHRFNFENRKVLSTFGLLGEGKNIETGLKALPEIIKHFPEVLYLILGKTHPNNIIDGIDVYRNTLLQIVTDLSLENHVLFIDEYLDTTRLLDYLKATDIYLFTSKDPNQAVSGTFSYAMSCACPIVASKISHTREVLTPDCGILVDIENVSQFAQATISLLSNDLLREEMGINAFHKTTISSWENVAIKHVNTYKTEVRNAEKIKFKYPPIKLGHLKRMTTALGIVQFCKISSPDLTTGYTLDDNARALIAICLHFKQTLDTNDLKYIDIYLDFIIRCQNETGDFVNYIDQYNEVHLEQNAEVNLEDSNARAIWALGTLISNATILPELITSKAIKCLQNSLKWAETISSPRSIGFATKGLYLFNASNPKLYVTVLIDKLNQRLITLYNQHRTTDWKWFENYMTYANSILPESMLYAYLATNNEKYREIALESFDFLRSKLFLNDRFKVISNDGWFHKNSEPNEFGEQPIDVSYTVQSLDLFFRTFEDTSYKKQLRQAFEWFLGRNHLGQIMYNPISGGGYDGLEENNVNLNQGAESTVCYLTARLIMEGYKKDTPKVIDLIKTKANLAFKS